MKKLKLLLTVLAVTLLFVSCKDYAHVDVELEDKQGFVYNCENCEIRVKEFPAWISDEFIITGCFNKNVKTEYRAMKSDLKYIKITFNNRYKDEGK